jgi:alanyl-tRNA synthetase
MMVAESESAAACIINKQGNIVCAAGEKSNQSARKMIEKSIAQLGGSGGGSDRIAQGKVEKVGMVEL